MIDYSAEGLFVAFRVVEPTVVELLDAIDLKEVRGCPGGAIVPTTPSSLVGRPWS